MTALASADRLGAVVCTLSATGVVIGFLLLIDRRPRRRGR